MSEHLHPLRIRERNRNRTVASLEITSGEFQRMAASTEPLVSVPCSLDQSHQDLADSSGGSYIPPGINSHRTSAMLHFFLENRIDFVTHASIMKFARLCCL